MAKLAESFAKFFYEADKDKNGWLSIDEMIKAVRKGGFDGTDDDIRKQFYISDKNKDHKVMFEEYLGSVGKQPEAVLKRAQLRYLFRTYDKNESGYLEKTDIEKTFQDSGLTMTEADTAKVMSLMDTNKDGKVNYEEFLNYYITK